MFTEKTRKKIQLIRKSIIYIFPILFIFLMGVYFLIDKNQQKFEYKVQINFTNSIEDELNKFKINTLLNSYYEYIPKIDNLNIDNYHKSYVNEMTSIIGTKTMCLIRDAQIQTSLINNYELHCMDTKISADKIKKIVDETHTFINTKYIELYNQYVYKIVYSINQDEDPKKFFISNIADYKINIFKKNYFKDWVIASFFSLLSLSFVIYFGCLLLLNSRLD